MEKTKNSSNLALVDQTPIFTGTVTKKPLILLSFLLHIILAYPNSVLKTQPETRIALKTQYL